MYQKSGRGGRPEAAFRLRGVIGRGRRWGKSGRRDSNAQHSAWKADALPLSYARGRLKTGLSPSSGGVPLCKPGKVNPVYATPSGAVNAKRRPPGPCQGTGACESCWGRPVRGIDPLSDAAGRAGGEMIAGLAGWPWRPAQRVSIEAVGPNPDTPRGMHGPYLTRTRTHPWKLNDRFRAPLGGIACKEVGEL